jgi:hypothetical protein
MPQLPHTFISSFFWAVALDVKKINKTSVDNIVFMIVDLK